MILSGKEADDFAVWNSGLKGDFRFKEIGEDEDMSARPQDESFPADGRPSGPKHRQKNLMLSKSA